GALGGRWLKSLDFVLAPALAVFSWAVPAAELAWCHVAMVRAERCAFWRKIAVTPGPGYLVTEPYTWCPFFVAGLELRGGGALQLVQLVQGALRPAQRRLRLLLAVAADRDAVITL